MTCIVAFRNSKGVVMGADSCAGAYHRANTVKTSKVSHVGEYMIGYTSSFRMGQILHHTLNTTKHNEKHDFMWHLINVLVPELRTAMKSGGAMITKDGQDSCGEFLLAYKNRLFVVQSDFSVLEYEDDFIATGCGEEWAMGALYALKNDKRSAKEKLGIALEAATRFSAYVRPPFHFIHNYSL